MEYTFTVDNFEAEVLKSDVPVLVDFWAPWCGPCRTMGPIVEQISDEIDSGKLKVGKCNVDENGALAMNYGIMSIPAFFIFKNGEVIDQIVGSMDKDAFKERILKHAQ